MAVNKVVFGAVAIMDISDSTVTEETLAEGVTAYDKSGEKITGTMKQSADPKLQAKTATPTTSAQTVKPDSGYDGLSQVTVNAMPTATQATPSITVSSAGLITASATQSAGYVSSGTKSATKQLTTQAAKTVTPTTSNQTAVASGRYTTGAITVKGDANLKADNIKSGVSIFGVAGTYEGSGGSSGGGGGSVETCTVTFSCPGALNLVFNYVENGEVKCRALYFPYNVDSEEFNNFGGSSILKGSFLICGKSNTTTSSPIKITTSGEVEVVKQNTPYTAGAIFKINGDCTITITGAKIQTVGTDEIYDDAVDVEGAGYRYTETEEPIETESNEEEV